MPSSNYDYWREREELQRQHNISELDEYNARVAAIYQMMIDMATQEINAFYGKYASAEGITIQEAKARISKLDIEEYARKAAEYVKNHDLSESANAEMRLYNATMKINRLELLKANIGLYMCGGFSEIEKMTGMKLDEATMAEFERLAGILGKTINNADKRVDSLVNASFQNATYSDRIWMYQDALKDKLSQLLTSGMIQGKSPAELARELRKEFDVSRHQAERLMRTELCRVQTEAQKLSYKNNGYRKYIYLALGADPCEDCLDNDGRVFNVDEMAIAVNAPPMHPNCMCSTAPYFDELSAFFSEKDQTPIGFFNEEYSDSAIDRNDISLKSIDEMKEIVSDMLPIADRYSSTPSRWSGQVIYSKTGSGYSIKTTNVESDGYLNHHIALHELFHSKSIAYHDTKTYLDHLLEEEVVVQFLTQEVSRVEKLTEVIGGYEKNCDALREINSQLHFFDTNLEFATHLFAKDLLDREQYVIELVMNSEIGRKMPINEIMDIMNTVEGIFHGMF